MKKNTALLISVFILLLILTYIILQKPGESSSESAGRQYAIKVDSSKIDRIEIRNQFGNIELSKKDSIWFITKPANYLVHAKRIEFAISALANMTIVNIASENPKRHKFYEVDPEGKEIKVFTGTKQIARFIIGKSGPVSNQTYVRVLESQDVLLVRGSFNYFFDSPDIDWRDRSIFKASEDGIKEIKYEYGKEVFTIKKMDTNWTVDEIPADRVKVDELVTKLSNITSDLFPEAVPKVEPKVTTVIHIDGEKLNFAKIDKEQYYINSMKSPNWSIIFKSKAESLFAKKNDLITGTSEK